jgi:hypothetical protein
LPPNDDEHSGKSALDGAPEAVKVSGSDERALIYRDGKIISWKVVD